MPPVLEQTRRDFFRALREGRGEDEALGLVEAYRRWELPPKCGPDAIEVFAPTLVAFNRFGSYNSQLRPALGTRQLWDWECGILHICLYADRLWVPDPLELLARDLTSQRMNIAIHEPLITRPELARQMSHVLREDLSELVQAGIICLYPAISSYEQSVAGDLFGQVRSFSPVELGMAWPDLYVAEGILFAKAFQASYTALHNDEFHALKRASENISQALGLADQRVLATLPHLKLPFFEGMDAKSLVRVRATESSFEDFRKFLREMAGRLFAGLEDPRFDKEVQKLEAEHITPALIKLNKDIIGVTSLKSRLTDARVDFTAGALTTLAITGDPVLAATGGAMTALAKALAKLILAREPSRKAASAVYLFHTGRPMSALLGG